MHERSLQLRDRLRRLADERLRPAVIAEHRPLEVAAWTVPGRPGTGGDGEPVPVSQGLAAPYRSIEPGTDGARWGAPWATTWFRLRGTVPSQWAGAHVQAIIDLGFHGGGPGFQAEGLLYDARGHVIKGLHPRNHTIELTCASQRRIHWYVEAAGNPDILSEHGGNTPKSDPRTADTFAQYQFARADLVVLDDDVDDLLMDLEVLGALAEELDHSTQRRHDLLAALERAADTIDPFDVPGTAAAARSALAPVLARRAAEGGHRITAVGHAHIDTAWLWPLRETARKVARTFANVTDLMERHPELVFAGSQAQQYAWVQERHPDLFARVADAVRRGQWVPVGGAWVEADGNLPGGEALARQLVYGKRYFREAFGVETTGVWLPDSFGYTGAYPQIAALAGNDWFLTQKLSWNDTNVFPHHTMWWEGIDGTRILTHFPPADTYNGSMDPREVVASERRFKDKGWSASSLYPFGYGDGGGGPTPQMLARYARMADLDGMPRVSIESPLAFVQRARADLEQATAPPVWRGELYLELHRGTFTTQARSKAWNRRVEHLLREAELWAATAALSCDQDSPYPYPVQRFDRLWRTVLTLQFHDILPGSSITWVHRDAERTYARVAVWLEELIAQAAAVLVGDASDASNTLDLAVLNASPYPRREVVAVSAVVAAGTEDTDDTDGAAGRQRLADGCVAMVVQAPAGGIGRPAGAADDFSPVTLTDHPLGWVLENGLIRVVIDTRGLVMSCRCLLADRELIAPGMAGNLLQVHPDTPSHWDAWDLDEHYRHRVSDLSECSGLRVVDSGPLQAGIEVVRTHRASTITQTLRVRAGSPRLDVSTLVDWQERDTVLKAAFPLDVLSDTERSEIQYGHVTRATHENTSWDAARFETYAHRWVHVGEASFGVALITDSTYGHDIRRTTGPNGLPISTLRLTLLRSPSAPDPSADRGEHRFGYALLAGDVPAAIEHGYAFNLPLRVLPARRHGPAPLVTLDAVRGSVIVEAVKLADDESGDLVMRCYEGYGGRGQATLRLNPSVLPVAAVTVVTVCDLLEDPLPPERGGATITPHPDGGIPIALRPFQILTLRVRMR